MPLELLEPLESRMLLSGVTLITHGYQLSGNVGPWLDRMADEVADRVGPDASVFKLVVEEDANKLFISSFNQRYGPSLSSGTNSRGEIVISLDWADASNDLIFISTTDIAELVVPDLFANPMLRGLGVGLMEMPMHLIGHSRGASMALEMARIIGEMGAWVDHITLLDPNDHAGIDEDVGRPTDNVVFAEDYYQNSIGNVIRGLPVEGSMSLELTTLGGEGYVSEHSDVHLWYHGTVDLSNQITDGTETLRPNSTDWYVGNQGPRGKKGYYYSRIGGGVRPDDGVGRFFHGNGVRQRIGLSGSQWANIGNLVVMNGSRFKLGDQIHLEYLYQDRDSDAKATFFLDPDQNPYNNNEVRLGTRQLQKTGDKVFDDDAYVSAKRTNSSSNYVLAKISDGSHTRYAYAPKAVAIEDPGPLKGHGFTIADLQWVDAGSHGDGDGVMEARESPRLKIKLRSKSRQSIQNVNAVLKTRNSSIAITDDSVHFDNFSPGQSRWSVDWFEMDLNFSLSPGRTHSGQFQLEITYKRDGTKHFQTLDFTQKFLEQKNWGNFKVVNNEGTTKVDDTPNDHHPYNDNKGDIQSGEDVDLKPLLEYSGLAPVQHVDMALIYNGPKEHLQRTPQANNYEGYPNLNPGDRKYPSGNNDFGIQSAWNFSGILHFDVKVRVDEGRQGIYVINDGLKVEIKPAPWMFFQNGNYYDFKSTTTKEDVEYTLTVKNGGSYDMEVKGIDLFGHDDVLATHDAFPWTLRPGESKDIRLRIETENLDGTIVREIRILSDGRIKRPLEDYGRVIPRDRFVIVGKVSPAPPNQKPTITSLSDSPDPVIQGRNLTLIANNVADPDGSIIQVEFYRDSDNDGVLDVGTDSLLGLDVSANDGWSWTGSTKGFPLEANRYFARAQDNDRDWSNVVNITGTVNAPPPPVLSINDVSMTESDSGQKQFNFTVSLSAVSNKIVRVQYNTTNGTAITADNDYQARSDTLTFLPGQTSKTISIAVNGDKKVEPNETFFVNLSNAVNATIADSRGIATIRNDDDPVPEITVRGLNNIIINDNDAMPRSADGTDFGGVGVANGSIIRTFMIHNQGDAVLKLTGNPKVEIINGSSHFTVIEQPSSSVASNAATTFKVKFDPGVIGVKNADISIMNNDNNETPYNFTIKGEGLPNGGDQPDTDSYEPDNSLLEAARAYKKRKSGRINLFGTPQTHSIHTANDEDWTLFVVRSRRGADVAIWTSGQGQGDTLLELKQTRGRRRRRQIIKLATDDNSGQGDYSRIEQHLNRGVYYLRVSGNGSNIIQSYDLHIDITGAALSTPADAFEPDNNAKLAKRIYRRNPIAVDGTPQMHSIHLPNDVDWVPLVIRNRRGADVTIETQGGDTKVSLLDRRGRRVLTSALSVDGSARIESRHLGRGSYFIVVEENGRDAKIDQYKLSVTATSNALTTQSVIMAIAASTTSDRNQTGQSNKFSMLPLNISDRVLGSS